MSSTPLPPPDRLRGFDRMVDQVRDYAIFLTDRDGIISTWNPAAAALKGYTAEETIGRHFGFLYTDEDQRDGRPGRNLALAAAHGTHQEERWRKCKDGSVFWAMVELIALTDEAGVLTGFCKITRSLARLKAAQDELQRETERAHATLAAIHDGVISCQQDGTVDYLNPRAEALTGWCKLRAEGSALDDVLAAGRALTHTEGEAALIAELGVSQQGSLMSVMQLADGARRIVETTTSPIGVQLRPAGAVIVMRDITVQLETHKGMKDAEKHKDEFLAMLAHELRNPLAPVSAAAELLNSGKLTTAGSKRASQVIIRQVRHMLMLVDDLLDASRVTRGLVALDRQPLDMKRILGSAIEQAHPGVEAKQHALAVSLPRARAHVYGDANRLIQVFVNLLNNACKYTPAHGDIRIDLVIEADEVVVKISDTGIGMDPALQVRAFKLFEQAQRSSDRFQGGLGIGLALVHKLTELHQGRVSCDSAGAGRGSTFTVRLPQLKPRDGIPERRTSVRTAAATKAPMTILVVDDNVDAGEMLSRLLELEGHAVTFAVDGHAALAAATARQFDVCVLDISLPGMSGFDLARQILTLPGHAGAPTLVALTGYSQDTDRSAAMAAGFTSYLVKPVDPMLMNSTLADISAARTAAGASSVLQ